MKQETNSARHLWRARFSVKCQLDRLIVISNKKIVIIDHNTSVTHLLRPVVIEKQNKNGIN